MTTKLEAMVGYLAGRDADPSLLDELANPSSEASHFLEADLITNGLAERLGHFLSHPASGHARS